MKLVGYWISDKKGKKLDFDGFAEDYKLHDLKFQRLDLSRPLNEQGKFDLIVHKFIELIVLADIGSFTSQSQLDVVQKYLSEHPEVILLDSLELIAPMLNRSEQYRCTHQCIKKHGLDDRVFVPSFCSIGDVDSEEIESRIRQASISFPILCKAELAHGTDKAHEMSLVFNLNGFRGLTPPYVAQSFVNHNAKLYKIFVVGSSIHVCDRPSIKNLTAGSNTTLFFHSHDVSKDNSTSHLTELNDEDKSLELTQPDLPLFHQIANAIRAEFGLDLIGIDIIHSNQSGKFAIIDINAFPGYEKMPDYFLHLERLIREKLNLPPSPNSVTNHSEGFHHSSTVKTL